MVIGLVGKSCSGKNHVGSILEQMGLLVWDLDRMCHDGLVANVDSIVAAFGPQVVSCQDGQLVVSRPEIGKVVFRDPSKRTALEDILYPWLKRQILDWSEANPDGVLVINGALLYRSGFDALCSSVIYVDASYEVRLGRAMARDGVTEETFALRENSQKDVDFRTVSYRCPVHLLMNNGEDEGILNRQVFSICVKIGIIKGNCN